MATVREKLEHMLTERGMFDSQAKSVIDMAIPTLNNLVVGYVITYNSPSTDYTTTMYNIWFNSIRPIALKWIDDNVPQAWYRPMFVERTDSKTEATV